RECSEFACAERAHAAQALGSSVLRGPASLPAVLKGARRVRSEDRGVDGGTEENRQRGAGEANRILAEPLAPQRCQERLHVSGVDGSQPGATERGDDVELEDLLVAADGSARRCARSSSIQRGAYSAR